MSNWMSSFMPWDFCALPPQWGNMPFPLFQDAVNETALATQAPIKMVTHCAANAGFSAVQGLGDLQRPDGGVAPLSNISLIVGETGERKSTVDACFFAGIFSFGDDPSSSSDQSVEHKVQMKVWRLKEKMLEKQLAASLDNDAARLQRLMEAFKEHARQRPRQNPTFLYQDTSLTSLKLGLAAFPSACVHSTEGMSILQGPLFEEQGLLCSLHSGEPHRYNRWGKNIILRDKRLCVSAHSQPKRTFRYLATVGEDFRDSGLAARMTVCLLNSTQSTQGYRLHDSIVIPTTCRDRFNDRIRYLLKISVRAARRNGFQRRKIKFSPNVTREYLEYANRIEREMRPNGKFQFARDYANRLADKVGRLAAMFHLLEDFEGDISLDTFWAARAFYTEETSDFMFLFHYLPSEQFLADQLVKWLQQQPINYGEIGHKKAYIQQRAPVALRKKAVLDPVLALLEQQGALHLETFNNAVYVCPGQKLENVVAHPPPYLSVL
jgi:hypothetical protein